MLNDFGKNFTWIYFRGHDNITNFAETNFRGFFSKNAKSTKVNLAKINLRKLQSYLGNRQQRVNVSKSYGSRGIIITGLPHDSILGRFHLI